MSPSFSQVGDLVVLDGGMVSLEVMEKAGPDVRCIVVDPGIILSRANLTFRRGGKILRGRNSMLPVLSSKVIANASFLPFDTPKFPPYSAFFPRADPFINNLYKKGCGDLISSLSKTFLHIVLGNCG